MKLLKTTWGYLGTSRIIIAAFTLIGIGLWCAAVMNKPFAEYDPVTLYSLLVTFASLFITYITYEVAQSIISYKELSGVKEVFAEIRTGLLREGFASKKITKDTKDRIEYNIKTYYTINKKKRSDALNTKIGLLAKAAEENRSNSVVADMLAHIDNLITL